MKLSWHDAHFMFMPRNTCDTFWANCSSGFWLAFTLPRHLMPRMKPSDSGDGAISSRTNWSNGMFVHERAVQPAADLLAAAVDVAGARVVVPQQVVPEREPVLGIGAVVGQQLVDQLLALGRDRRRPERRAAARASASRPTMSR